MLGRARSLLAFPFMRQTAAAGLAIAVVTLGICVAVGAVTDATVGRRLTLLAVPAVYSLTAAKG